MLCLMSNSANSIITIVSLVLGLASVILAYVSIHKANKDSKDANIMFKHIAMSQEYLMQKAVQLKPADQHVVNLDKDTVCFEKLSHFKPSNIDEICKELAKLSIKPNLLEGIRNFLKDKTKHEYSTNFRSKAGTKTQDQSAVESNAELITIIHKLIDYGIYVSYRI